MNHWLAILTLEPPIAPLLRPFPITISELAYEPGIKTNHNLPDRHLCSAAG